MTPSQSVPTQHNVENWCHWVCDQLEAADLWFGHGTDNPWDESVWLVSHCLLSADAGTASTTDTTLTQTTSTQTASIETPLIDVTALLALDTDSPDFPQRGVTERQQQHIVSVVEQRITTRRPLAYLINIAWFAGLPYFVDERVIVPRAHLGEWINEAFAPWVSEDKPVTRILDIGTGSGCIAIALALAFPQATVDGVDLDPQALEVANINARLHGVQDRVNFICSDIFPSQQGTDAYDIICSNPPYVDASTYASMPAEYLCEPQIAFVADNDGTLIAQEILKRAPDFLRTDGLVFMEVGTARPALEARYPQLPLTWLASSEEEDVILMIDRQTLETHWKHT